MRRILLLLGLMACQTQPEGTDIRECTDGIDNDGDNVMDCEELICIDLDVCCPEPNRVENVYPADGGVDFYHRDVIEVKMERSDGVALSLTLDGELVPGHQGRSGTLFTLTPFDPLEPLSAYEIHVVAGCDEHSFGFSTSGVGESSGSVSPGVYPLDLAQGTWLGGSAFSVFSKYAEVPLLLEVSAGLELSLTAAGTPSGDEDVCLPAVALTTWSEDPPWFAAGGPGELYIPFERSGWELARMLTPTIEASFGDDGAELVGVVFSAWLDFRSIEDEWVSCDGAAAVGNPCEPCPDGSGSFCAPFSVSRIPSVLDVDLSSSGLLLEDEPCALLQCADHAACEP